MKLDNDITKEPELDPILEVLKKQDNLELPMSGQFYDDMQARIMAKTMGMKIKPKPLFYVPRNFLRAHYKSWLQLSLSLALLFLLGKTLSPIFANLVDKSHVVQVIKNEKLIVNEIMSDPEAYSETLLSYQSQNDFFVDLAERSFNDISVEDLRRQFVDLELKDELGVVNN